ncbi:hypothetical protein [Streptomyces sp. 5-10]|uniref:hypothetical protein n=1 Tax=Streptomyces sp. 5-10 TaxID=878925 RepID=UPI00168A87A2|nr:hypothetical protein [Streptomyces sp. 5-10]MBD3004645.1 hypothetical protein [Streptomyces sp. 5-10]
MKRTQRDHLNDLALQAERLAAARRPNPKEGSAKLAASARAAHAIWAQVIADYDRRAPWLEDRDQLAEVLRLAHHAAWDAGFHTTAPTELADWMIKELRDAAGDRCPNGQLAPECTEIDLCESCWQDQQDEGDAIERSMELR